MIKLIINGAKGKMGTLASDYFKQQQNFELIAGLSREDNLTDALVELKPDVVLDLTSATAVYENTKTIIEHNIRPVIGSSGLTKSQITELQTVADSKKLGGLIIPNASVGAVLMMLFAKRAAEFFEAAEIIEMHHPQKKDAPSGTAIASAEQIASANKGFAYQGEETIAGACGGKVENIPVHSVRMPGLLAHQQIFFGNPGEILTLKHDVNDRQAYMYGLLLSCQHVMKLDQLQVGLEHILS